MFENQYTVDVKRYISWCVPPASQRRGFKAWMALLAASAAGTLLAYLFHAGDKMTSIGCLMVFISCYRGLFFHTFYARRQFYAICRSMGIKEQQWIRRSVADSEGITSCIDGAHCLSLRWKDVDIVREDARHVDIHAGEEVVRFEKDSFTRGTAEGFSSWLRDNLTEISIESGKNIYLI